MASEPGGGEPDTVPLPCNEELSSGTGFLYRRPTQQPGGSMVWVLHLHADKLVFSVELPATLSFLKLFRQLKVMARDAAGEATPDPVQEPYSLFEVPFQDLEARVSTGFALQSPMATAVRLRDDRWFLSSAPQPPSGPDTAEVVRLPEGVKLVTRVLVA